MEEEHITRASDRCVQQLFRDMCQDRYPLSRHIYTDGSRTTGVDMEVVGAAMTVPDMQYTEKCILPNFLSIFSAELFAIWMSLRWIVEQQDDTKYIILTDSLSSVSYLLDEQHAGCGVYRHIILGLLSQVNQASSRVAILWIPSHRGIPGNEAVDRAAKEATTAPVVVVPHLTRKDGKALFRRWMYAKWKIRWDDIRRTSAVGRHLYNIKKDTTAWPWASFPRNRPLETALARLRIGHSGLRGHLFRFGLHWSPLCDCGLPETVEHYFLDCANYFNQRTQLKRKLRSLGVEYSLQSLLGGGPSVARVQMYIAEAVASYLTSTGKMLLV
jgi:ribonuclease HI